MSGASRKLLGRSTSLFSRDSVWQVADGLEIESSEQYEIIRRLVLYQDVLYVTHHRMYGAGYLIATGLLSLFFIGMAMLIVGAGGTTAWGAGLIMLIIGLPALIAFALRLMFRLDVITVLGRRSNASIRFRFRKRRARELYVQICSAVRNAQDRMASEIAAADVLPPIPPDAD